MSDKKTLVTEEDTSTNRNLLSVGGHSDTPVDLMTVGNSDANHPCLNNRQTVLIRTPTQPEFVECWSESIIRNGSPPTVVDDPLFRKTLVTTSRMGQTSVSIGKGTVPGKRDTTVPNRHIFTRKIIPTTDKSLDEEGMTRLKPKMLPCTQMLLQWTDYCVGGRWMVGSRRISGQ